MTKRRRRSGNSAAAVIFLLSPLLPTRAMRRLAPYVPGLGAIAGVLAARELSRRLRGRS